MDSSQYSEAISSYESSTSSFEAIDSSEMSVLQSVDSTVPSLEAVIDSLATPVGSGVTMPNPHEAVGPFHRMDFFDWWGNAFKQLGEKGVVAIPNDTLEDFLYWLYQWAREFTADYARFKSLVEGILKGLAGDITAINGAIMQLNTQIQNLTTMMTESVDYISSAASTALSEGSHAMQVASAASAKANLADMEAKDAEKKANAALSSNAANSEAIANLKLSTAQDVTNLQNEINKVDNSVSNLESQVSQADNAINSLSAEDNQIQSEIGSEAKEIAALKALALQPEIIPMNAVGNVQPNGWQPALNVDTWHCGAWVGIQWLVPSDHKQGGYVVFFMNRYITNSSAWDPWGGEAVSSNPKPPAPDSTPSATVQTGAQIYEGDFTPVRNAFSEVGISLPNYWTGWFSHSMMVWTDNAENNNNYNGNCEIVCAINGNKFSAWAFSFPGMQADIRKAFDTASDTQCANCQIQTNFYS